MVEAAIGLASVAGRPIPDAAVIGIGIVSGKTGGVWNAVYVYV